MLVLSGDEIEGLKLNFDIIKMCTHAHVYVKVFEGFGSPYDYEFRTIDFESLDQLEEHLRQLSKRSHSLRVPPTLPSDKTEMNSPWLALHILTNILMEL